MLKQFLILLCLLPFALPAQASPQLAKSWGGSATQLKQQTTALILQIDRGKTMNVSEAYALDVYRFGRNSDDLARWMKTSAGPEDLGCIFRGMSEEAETQLLILEQASQPARQKQALQRLVYMFADAELMAETAAQHLPRPSLSQGKPQSSCQADTGEALKALQHH